MPIPVHSRTRRRVATLAALACGAAVLGVAPSASATSSDLTTLLQSAAQGSVVALGGGTYTVRDFASNLHGATLGDVGLHGAGAKQTTIEMVPDSSTKAGAVPTAKGTTNPLYVLYTSGGTPGLSDFHLAGTDQGHLYGGLFVGAATNARVSHITITDVPGNAHKPPGETFSLNDWRTSGSVYSHIVIDGGGLAAVDFGANSSRDITVKHSTFTGVKYSSGMALWQTTNITLDHVTLKHNRAGINFERDSGRITIIKPVVSKNRKFDFQFGTDGPGADVVIRDPVLAKGQKLRIEVPHRYHGVKNRQKRSHIHVYVNGVDKTGSLVRFV